jgi:hypothetical protein
MGHNWSKIKNTVLSFWALGSDDKLRQKRLSYEHLRATELRQQQSEAGKSSARKKKERLLAAVEKRLGPARAGGDAQEGRVIKPTPDLAHTNLVPAEPVSGDSNALENRESSSTTVGRTLNFSSKETSTPTSTSTKEEKDMPVADAPEFLAFWAIFPHRPGDPKKPAAANFSAAIKRGADPQAIIAGAKRLADRAKRERTEPKFLLKAAKWIDEERWKDDVPAASVHAPVVTQPTMARYD